MQWIANPDLSIWYAAFVCASNKHLLNQPPTVSESLRESLDAITHRLDPSVIEVHLSALTEGAACSDDDLAQTLKSALIGFPYAEELSDRMGPLRMQWDARGPGMVRSLSRSIGGKHSDPDSIRIFPVYPWVGGHGMLLPKSPDVQSSVILVEAVLTDIDRELPESTRLAWLHAQLFSRTSAESFDPSTHALAAIMPTLSAAENVQLASCDTSTVNKALQMWLHIASPDELPDELPVGMANELATILVEWWDRKSQGLNDANGASAWSSALSDLRNHLPSVPASR